MSLSANLDHVVLLLPYKDVLNPPDWITNHFTLSPGGRHADGKTENRLILFADGTYLELIAFIDDDPARREGHWWDKPFGMVDWALTTPDAAFPELAAIKDRLSQTSTGISYTSPKEGGRVTPDGQELQWRVTFPIGTGRGSVPFWCHDVTPRSRRVPLTDANTTHPSGALGMAGILIQTTESSVSRLDAATAAILDKDLEGSRRYELDVLHEVPHAAKPSVRIQAAGPGETAGDLSLSLVVQSRQSVPDIRHEIGDGVVSVVFEPSRS